MLICENYGICILLAYVMKHQELCLLHCFYDRVENAELRIENLIEWYNSMNLEFDLD